MASDDGAAAAAAEASHRQQQKPAELDHPSHHQFQPQPLHRPTPPPPPPPPPSSTAVSSQQQQQQKKTKAKKPPPGTWSPIETAHLIESYREMWYSLKRGQLRTSHWEQVAQSLAHLCSPYPEITAHKSSVQCRHKLEKLRRRYRAERQIVLRRGHASSRWPFYEAMDLMERGAPSSLPKQHASLPHAPSSSSVPKVILPPSSSSLASPLVDLQQRSNSKRFAPGRGHNPRPSYEEQDEEEEDEEEEEEEEEEEQAEEEEEQEEEEDSDQPPLKSFPSRKRHRPVDHFGHNYRQDHDLDGSYSPAPPPDPRKKLPREPPISAFKQQDDYRNHPRYFVEKSTSSGGGGGTSNPGPSVGSSSSEMAAVIRYLGEGFLRMEQMKVQMQRETELFRADMELRRTEMVLEAQKHIAREFSSALGSLKKKKMVHSDEN